MAVRRFRSAAELAGAGRFEPGTVLLFGFGALHREYDGAVIGWRSTRGDFFTDDRLDAMFGRCGAMTLVRPEAEVAAEAFEVFADEVAAGQADLRLSMVAVPVLRAHASQLRGGGSERRRVA